MDNRSNTIAGWVLGAGIVALGASIVTAEMFHAGRPDKMGYPIEGVTGAGGDDAAEAEVPIANLLATADLAKGEAVFKRCSTCHTITPGGANGSGPNIHGALGKPIAKVSPGFAYSPALAGKGGNWGFEEMNQWLKSPKDFADGTKMSFAGLGKAEDRANLIAWMNSQGSNLPLPAPVAASPAAAAAEASDQPAAAGKAENEPVLNEATAATAKGGASNIHGEGAPAVDGRAAQTKDH